MTLLTHINCIVNAGPWWLSRIWQAENWSSVNSANRAETSPVQVPDLKKIWLLPSKCLTINYCCQWVTAEKMGGSKSWRNWRNSERLTMRLGWKYITVHPNCTVSLSEFSFFKLAFAFADQNPPDSRTFDLSIGPFYRVNAFLFIKVLALISQNKNNLKKTTA